MIKGISAVTLGTHEMPRAVRFYRALGFPYCSCRSISKGKCSRHMR